MVYEGARSLYGPALLALGASAAVVGLVTGAGEAMALVLRLFAGPVADRRGAHWSFTILGYGLTAVCVPLLAVAPAAGAAGLLVGSALILAERAGKALRSPSKSALLAHAAKAVGRGRGFGVHKALDQVGAFAGPLLVAAVIAVTGSLWAGYAWLAIPGVVALVVLVVIRRLVPDLTVFDPPDAPTRSPAPAASGAGARAWWRDALGSDLPRPFVGYALAAALTTAGLLVVPVLVALVPGLAFAPSFSLALVGVGVWAAAHGVQDSTIKALVADLVPAHRLAGAYGVFAAVQGAFAIVGGFAAGWLLDRSIPALVAVVALTQVGALVLLTLTLRAVRRG